MAKKSDLEIISISLTKDILHELDRMGDRAGYTSRSEIVRDSIRTFLKSKEEIDKVEGRVEGVLLLLYDHKAGHTVSEVRHRHMEVFRSFMHCDFVEKESKCCEVLMFSGEADKVREAHQSLQAIKHVEDARLFMA